jgi:hypothetical protein
MAERKVPRHFVTFGGGVVNTHGSLTDDELESMARSSSLDQKSRLTNMRDLPESIQLILAGERAADFSVRNAHAR